MSDELPIEFSDPDAQGRVRVNVTHKFRVTDGNLMNQLQELEESAFLHPEATGPRLKVLAARYFLHRFKQYIRNEPAALFYFEAFIQALRSSIFVLQKRSGSSSKFREWYSAKQEQMKSNSVLRAVIELRNLSEKEGLDLISFGTRTLVKHQLGGEVRAESGQPEIRLADVELENPIAALADALEVVSAVVEEAHKLGHIPPVEKPRRLVLEFLRETPEGEWEHFDPPG